MRILDRYIRNDAEKIRADRAEALAAGFAKRAAEHDSEGSFPFDNFAELREAGYYKLTAPREYGGDEISLYELVQLQERLARGDGSTALGVGWHVGTILHQLGSQADATRRRELDALFAGRPNLSEEDRQAIEHMFMRFQNQLLHRPRAAVRSAASDPVRGFGAGTPEAPPQGQHHSHPLLNAVRHLFGLGDLGGAFSVPTVRLGFRLGLFKALGEGDATADELARRAGGLAPRYVREWALAQAANGYIGYDGSTERFSLSPEQAMVFVVLL